MKNSEILTMNNIYEEMTTKGRHCYKYQPAGKPIIIVVNHDKEDAATEMIQELKKINFKFNVSA